MNSQEIRSYVESYFHSFESPFLENHESYFTVRLPVEVDKDLGNRPFYWTYVERIGIEPTPLQLTFIFDPTGLPEGLRGEELRFGSRRLHQIFASAKKHGKYIRLYENSPTNQLSAKTTSTPLVPWLGVNYKVEFICDQKRELLLSLGVNLSSGAVCRNFYSQIKDLNLTPKLPDYTFTMQPLFQMESAAEKLEEHINELLSREDSTWAEEAKQRLQEEKELVDSYYGQELIRQESSKDAQEDLPAKQHALLVEKEMRLKELEWQSEPRIQVSLINAGIFFLRTKINS